ncbi:transmembrane protein 18, partial [Tanacetum coccineum]
RYSDNDEQELKEWMDQDPLIKNQRKMDIQIAGVYLAERLNAVLSDNWKSFVGQNYFARHGVFLSVLWSVPLLIFATLILDQQALHSTTLKTWAGRVGDVVAAQPKFLARCKASSEAIYGTYGGAGVLNSESLVQRMLQHNMEAYNLASQVGMGGTINNPGNIPMQWEPVKKEGWNGDAWISTTKIKALLR